MKHKELKDPILEKAFETYVNEVKKHIDDARDALLGKGEFEASDVKRKFHNIRGGAGFFGLNEVESVAREIENLLNKSGTQSKKSRQKLLGLIDSLKELSN